jgi:plastocyanin
MRPAGRVRGRVWRAGLTLLAAAAVTAAACASGGHAPPVKHVVEIKGFLFQLDTVTAAVGDTLVWVNRDIVPHAVEGGPLRSGSIAPDSSWTYVARAAGTVDYICPFHPTMKGTLVVR